MRVNWYGLQHYDDTKKGKIYLQIVAVVGRSEIAVVACAVAVASFQHLHDCAEPMFAVAYPLVIVVAFVSDASG